MLEEGGGFRGGGLWKQAEQGGCLLVAGGAESVTGVERVAGPEVVLGDCHRDVGAVAVDCFGGFNLEEEAEHEEPFLRHGDSPHRGDVEAPAFGEVFLGRWVDPPPAFGQFLAVPLHDFLLGCVGYKGSTGGCGSVVGQEFEPEAGLNGVWRLQHRGVDEGGQQGGAREGAAAAEDGEAKGEERGDFGHARSGQSERGGHSGDEAEVEDDGAVFEFEGDDDGFDAHAGGVAWGEESGLGGEEGVEEGVALGGGGEVGDVAVDLSAGGTGVFGGGFDEDEGEAVEGLAIPGAGEDLPGGDGLAGGGGAGDACVVEAVLAGVEGVGIGGEVGGGGGGVGGRGSEGGAWQEGE